MRVRALCAVLHSFNHWFFHSVLVLLWCCRWTLHTWKDACSFNMCGTPVCFILLFFLLCIFPGWTDCWCCCYLLLFLFSVLRFYQLLLEKLSEYHHAPEAIAKKKKTEPQLKWEPCVGMLPQLNTARVNLTHIWPIYLKEHNLHSQITRKWEKLFQCQTKWHIMVFRR